MSEFHPALTVRTVFFHERDKDAAARIGKELYDQLARLSLDLLSYHSGGVLVFPAADGLKEQSLPPARHSVAVVVISEETSKEPKVFERCAEWQESLGADQVFAVAVGPGGPQKLPIPFIDEVGDDKTPFEDRIPSILERILLRLAILLLAGEEITLFFSHAEHDYLTPGPVAQALLEHAKRPRFAGSFEVHDLAGGDPLAAGESHLKKIRAAADRGLFIVIYDDLYSSRPWCQEQLLEAKRHRLPILVVEAFEKGQGRSLAYAGNVPTLPWGGDPAAVIPRALAEFVRERAFLLLAEDLIERAALPAGTIGLARAPELFDVSSGALQNFPGGVVLHPDPELPVEERDALRRANTSLHLATPASAFGPVLRHDRPSEGDLPEGGGDPLEGRANPLDDFQLAISLSGSPEAADGSEEFGPEHVWDATTAICRTVVSAGAAIGYGGDFRPPRDQGEPGYTQELGRLLVQLFETYNKAGGKSRDFLHSYLAAHLSLGEVTENLALQLHHLKEDIWPAQVSSDPENATPEEEKREEGPEQEEVKEQEVTDDGIGQREVVQHDLVQQIPVQQIPVQQDLAQHHFVQQELTQTESDPVALKPAQEAEQEPRIEVRVPFGPKAKHDSALYFSDMRQVMAVVTDARVLLGGKTQPKEFKGDRSGYGGLYPGVVEEAWWTLKKKRPLYIVGGFGGAAALVGHLLRDGELPKTLGRTLARQQRGDFYRRRAKEIKADPYFEKLGLPSTMEKMCSELADLLKEYPPKRGEPGWNGLTREENETLSEDRNPLLISSLIIRGLLNVRRQRFADKLDIELVHGSITDAEGLDAIAVSVLDDQPLGGAGAALDRVLEGRASLARDGSSVLIPVDSDRLDARWIFLTSLGRPTGLENLEGHIAEAARKASGVVERHQFTRLGVIAFGASLASKIEDVADAMLEGFGNLPPQCTVIWFEQSDDRFEALRDHLRSKKEQVALTTRFIESERKKGAGGDFWLHVELDGRTLKTTAIPPLGTPVAPVYQRTVWANELDALSVPGGPPSREKKRKQGRRLGQLLFGAKAADLLSAQPEARLMVVHDAASSRLPFELMRAETAKGNPIRPALGGGLNRRIAMRDPTLRSSLRQPVKPGKIKVLLVANPGQNLPHAEVEADCIKKLLAKHDDTIEVEDLRREKATPSAILERLQTFDVLHYCGHAFYRGSGAENSGLSLGQGELTMAELRDAYLALRFVFVNSCETGRLSVEQDFSGHSQAAAFAEIFLRSGVAAYLGTYWQVDDEPAARFAMHIYRDLAAGQTLDRAVRLSRRKLETDGHEDWGSYLLFGDGDFRLRNL